MFNPYDLLRHIKSGKLVVVEPSNNFYIEETGKQAYVYREVHSLRKWVRSREIMEDGRFEVIKSNPYWDQDGWLPLYALNPGDYLPLPNIDEVVTPFKDQIDLNTMTMKVGTDDDTYSVDLGTQVYTDNILRRLNQIHSPG